MFRNRIGSGAFITDFREYSIGRIEKLIKATITALLPAAGRVDWGRSNSNLFFHEQSLAFLVYEFILVIYD